MKILFLLLASIFSRYFFSGCGDNVGIPVVASRGCVML